MPIFISENPHPVIVELTVMRRLSSIFFLVALTCTIQPPTWATFVPGSLGISLSDVSPDASPPPGADRPHGALVDNSAGGSSQFRTGDLIVAYNGAHVESSQALKRMLAETPAGREVEIRVIREGTPRLLRSRLRAAPPPPNFGPAPLPKAEREPIPPKPRQLGARVVSLDPDIARYIGWAPGEGLQVTEVLDGSHAGKSDLRKGALLLEIEGQSIRSPEHFLLVLNQSPREDVDLTVHRNGGRHTVFLRFNPESADQ
jgi:serine protease Do